MPSFDFALWWNHLSPTWQLLLGCGAPLVVYGLIGLALGEFEQLTGWRRARRWSPAYPIDTPAPEWVGDARDAVSDAVLARSRGPLG